MNRQTQTQTDEQGGARISARRAPVKPGPRNRPPGPLLWAQASIQEALGVRLWPEEAQIGKLLAIRDMGALVARYLGIWDFARIWVRSSRAISESGPLPDRVKPANQ